MYKFLEVAVKAVASTINLIVLYTLVIGRNKQGEKRNDDAFKAYIVFMLLNLTGIWI